MTESKLDMTGLIPDVDHLGITRGHKRFDDLSPFAQGYAEAALRAFYEANRDRWLKRCGPHARITPRFSDLAPSTLAAMLKDCEVWQRYYGVADLKNSGAILWGMRQRGECASDFPPVTLYLRDDGLIYEREAA